MQWRAKVIEDDPDTMKYSNNLPNNSIVYTVEIILLYCNSNITKNVITIMTLYYREIEEESM